MEETHFMFSSDMGYYPFIFFLDSMFANSLSHRIYINTNVNATVHSLPLHPVINVLISAHQAIKYLSFLIYTLSVEAQRGGKSAFLVLLNTVKDGHPHGGCSYVMFSLFQSFLLGTLLFKM